MKLAIMFDDDDCEVVVEEIEHYDFNASGDRCTIINAIGRTVNKVKAFRAASPKLELED